MIKLVVILTLLTGTMLSDAGTLEPYNDISLEHYRSKYADLTADVVGAKGKHPGVDVTTHIDVHEYHYVDGGVQVELQEHIYDGSEVEQDTDYLGDEGEEDFNLR